MKLKVLPLDGWMKIPFIREDMAADKDIIPIEPVLNRDGYYLQGDKVWFEINGSAYLIPNGKTQFLLTVKVLSHKPLREIEIYALTVLKKSKLLSAEQAKLLGMEYHVKHLKAIRRDSLKRMNYFKK